MQARGARQLTFLDRLTTNASDLGLAPPLSVRCSIYLDLNCECALNEIGNRTRNFKTHALRVNLFDRISMHDAAVIVRCPSGTQRHGQPLGTGHFDVRRVWPRRLHDGLVSEKRLVALENV